MEPCTHPELAYCFNVIENSYQFACKECALTLEISAYETVKYMRLEWRAYLIRMVAQTFGAQWGQKAREWLERTEEPI